MKQLFKFDLLFSDCSSVPCSFKAASLVEAYRSVQDHIEAHPKWIVIAVEFLSSEPV